MAVRRQLWHWIVGLASVSAVTALFGEVDRTAPPAPGPPADPSRERVSSLPAVPRGADAGGPLPEGFEYRRYKDEWDDERYEEEDGEDEGVRFFRAAPGPSDRTPPPRFGATTRPS